MILNFDELHKYEFSLSDIRAIKQRPSYRTLALKSRLFNSFMYIVEGSCEYSYEGGEFSLGVGSLVYLPYNSRHLLTVTSESICFYRVDFTVKIGKEVVLFSDRPLKMTDNTPAECAEIIASLEADYGIEEDSVERMKRICEIFSILRSRYVSPAIKRLMPAVSYLRENAVCGVRCDELAELCFLSTSRFYELFGAEFGMSPLEYRDKMIIKRACAMLETEDMSVKEVALAVGFENAAYFSRFFKKHTGHSPSEYGGVK